LGIIQPTFDSVLVGELTRLKGLVVDPSAFFQHCIQNTPLAVLQVDAVFVGLAHTLSIAEVYVNSTFVRLWVKAAKAERFIPPLKHTGIRA
jgi:hypothetical protein